MTIERAFTAVAVVVILGIYAVGFGAVGRWVIAAMPVRDLP